MSTADWAVWTAVFVGGALTFGLRASFIALYGRLGGLPEWFERALAFVPAAVLAGLVLPSLLVRNGDIVVSPGNSRLLAGAVGLAVAWVTENTLATIAAGMAAFWTLRFLL